MNTSTRVVGFVVALAAMFALALGVGNAFGPANDPRPAADPHAVHGSGAPEVGEEAAEPADPPGGLVSTQDGFTLSLAESRAEAGVDVPVEFTITGPDGEAVTSYDVEREKLLHLIAVRRDVSGYQHVHPELSADGTWTAELDLTAGPWRLIADFRASDAEPLTLGVELAVAGDYQPVEAAQESRIAEVDGYTVTLDGQVSAGDEAQLTVTVEQDGAPVSDLEPYLGAYGHLVALRAGDLGYLHFHPDGTPGDGKTAPGPDVVFHTAVPSPGIYHLFLDFQHGGEVHTAAFTVATTEN